MSVPTDLTLYTSSDTAVSCTRYTVYDTCGLTRCAPIAPPSGSQTKQVLNDVNFRSMVSAIRHGASVPSKRGCIDIMRNVKGVMIAKITALLKGEHVCITTDGWTSCANDTYMSLTLSLVTKEWKFVTISVDCSKSVGTTTGEALAEGILATLAKHSLQGKVTTLTTDCEPSMVKAGRILEASQSLVHIGCCNHRLESTTSIVFNGPGVKKVMALSRGLVSRYSQSSQMADRLAIFVTTYLEGAESKKVIQDVSTRWWSTFSMVARLLELRPAIEKHEEGDKIEPMLTAADWAVLKLIRPILEPFMTAQKLLEGAKYVTGSLVVPCIYDLRNELNDAIDDLQGSSDSDSGDDDADFNAAKAAVMPCVTALHKDFVNRWGEESDLLNYTEGIRRQPRGFKLVQVLATALDPRTKLLYGIDDDVKPMVWKLVQDEAVKIAVAKRQEANAAALTSPRSPTAVAAPPASAAGGSRKLARNRGGFMAALQSAGRARGQVGGGGDISTSNLIAGSVQLEVESFQRCDLLMMYREDSKGEKTFLDPLDWWRLKNADFPHLAILARRVLAIPATQAESERLFSCAGNIVTKNRNALSPENVELLVLLRHSWERVEQWEKSTAAETLG